ncbi:hypothetical protein [Moraxella oblonga]|uniref:hypothetical protein n=1 Tax=Moraxella oblonga TaxID=200413 RepID=UPI0012ECC76D|nr:hypothetical protein [Moraxella oblonga]
MGNDWSYDLGVILGICIFIPIYVMIDNHAIKSNNHILQKSLLNGVIIRAMTQSIGIVDIWAGLVATSMVGTIGEGGLFVGFALTVITGIILSGVVAILTGLLVLIMTAVKHKKSH